MPLVGQRLGIEQEPLMVVVGGVYRHCVASEHRGHGGSGGSGSQCAICECFMRPDELRKPEAEAACAGRQVQCATGVLLALQTKQGLRVGRTRQTVLVQV